MRTVLSMLSENLNRERFFEVRSTAVYFPPIRTTKVVDGGHITTSKLSNAYGALHMRLFQCRERGTCIVAKFGC